MNFIQPVKCLDCGNAGSEIIEVRRTSNGIRRRRVCKVCGRRYTTYEFNMQYERIEQWKEAVKKGDREIEALEKKLNNVLFALSNILDD